MFASRLPARLETNAVSRAVRTARESGRALIDLTETNPPAAGLAPPASTLAALAHPRGLRYEPDPLGLTSARQAVSAATGVPVDRLVLTASTSEAYALLFKLLCDAGDDVLVPAPGYPLFEWLAGLECVRPVPYRLDLAGGWCLDRAQLERAVTDRTRAIVLVSPNNPTGSVLHDFDREWLVEFAAGRGLALIADEVFADYPLGPGAVIRSLAGEERTLTFTLGGLSKSVGLPQLKLAWIGVHGPPSFVAPALDRLAIMADTYLSVGTPVQEATPILLAAGRDVRVRIAARLCRNLARLREAVAGTPITLLEPQAGWSAVLRVPAFATEEALVLRLLDDAAVVVHPGYFFDFDEEAFLIVSLIVRPEAFAEGLARLVRVAGAEP